MQPRKLDPLLSDRRWWHDRFAHVRSVLQGSAHLCKDVLALENLYTFSEVCRGSAAFVTAFRHH